MTKPKPNKGKAELIPDTCIACGKCESVCPVNAISYDEKGEPVIDFDKCIGCGKCVKTCPAAALKMAYPEADSVVVESEPEEEEQEERQIKRGGWKGIWVFVEQRQGHAHPVSWQLLGLGSKLAEDLGEALSAVILCNHADHLIDEAYGYGAERVYIMEDPLLNEYSTQPYTEGLVSLTKKYMPALFLVGATAIGRDLASPVATRLETGLTADCTSLSIEKDTRLLEQTRPAFGGNIMATIVCERARPQMASVRPDVFPVPAFIEGRRGETFREPFPSPGGQLLAKIIEITSIEKTGVDIAAADIIVSGGRGMAGPEHFKMLQELAALLGGVVAGSRSAVDEGWITYERQVGQTGKTVRPKLYVACGISGAIQHLVGMQNAERVIAINRDEHAPIFAVADLGIVGDVFEIVPAIIEALREEKSAKSAGHGGTPWA